MKSLGHSDENWRCISNVYPDFSWFSFLAWKLHKDTLLVLATRQLQFAVFWCFRFSPKAGSPQAGSDRLPGLQTPRCNGDALPSRQAAAWMWYLPCMRLQDCGPWVWAASCLPRALCSLGCEHDRFPPFRLPLLQRQDGTVVRALAWNVGDLGTVLCSTTDILDDPWSVT